jgi:subtilase family serine protease
VTGVKNRRPPSRKAAKRKRALKQFLAAWRLGGLSSLAVGLASCSTPSLPSPPPTQIAATASPTYVAVAGNVPPLTRRAIDLGRMDPAAKLTGVSLLFKRSPDQKAASRALLADLANPMSPRYHRWLRPSDVAASFGAAGADVADATAWLTAQGFTVHGPSPTGTRLLFSGTVGQLESAFRTEMHRFDLAGEPHFALALEPSLPTGLSRFVLGLRGVHDFQLRPLVRAETQRAASPEYLVDAGSGDDTLSLAPSDFATLYDIAPLYASGITGSGQSIGVVGSSDFNDADITAFRSTFGLDTTLTPVRDLVPYSGASAVGTPDYFGETELDLEWSGAVAKEATIHYVYTGNNPAYGPFDAIVWAIEEGTYPVLTASYASCEAYFTPSEDIYLESMGDAASMEGITVLNASGDWGPASCDAGTSKLAAGQGMSASWPASIPSFTAVGGTMFSWGDAIPQPLVDGATASASPFDTYWGCTFSGAASCAPLAYVPESGWNETVYDISALHYFWGASGGGVSTLFPKPYWQVGTTMSGNKRLLPDVAISAAWQQVGYVISQSWTTEDGSKPKPYPETLMITGGTSAASPSFAGILALVNQALAQKNPSLPVGLGNANPVLYAINASTTGSPAPAFHDITTGDSIVPCASGSPDCPTTPPYQFGYEAGPGYDLVTGLGSVDVNNLVTAWTSLLPTTTTLAVTTSGTTEGATSTLTATVSSTATSTALTGGVIFYVDTTDEGGLSDLSLVATGALTASVSGGLEGGTATASVVIPPGLLGQANIVAFYGGDAHYLASWSVPADKVDATSTLAVSPMSVTVNPNALRAFTTSGGVSPVQWNIVRDSTCNSKNVCARVEATSATAGVYEAGPVDGTTTIAAIDGDGAEVRVTIVVSGSPVDGGPFPPPWDKDAGAGNDGASDGGEKDASKDVRGDALEPDMAPDGSADAVEEPPPAEIGEHGVNPSGCSCRSAGHEQSPLQGGAGGLAAGLFFGLAFAVRRRGVGSGLR